MGTPFSPKQIRNAMDAESIRKVSEYQNIREEKIAAGETIGPNKVHLCIRNTVREFSERLGDLNDNQIKGNATNVLLRLTGSSILLKEAGEGKRFIYRLAPVARPIDLTKIVTLEKAKSVFKHYILDTGTPDAGILTDSIKAKFQKQMADAVKVKSETDGVLKIIRSVASSINTFAAESTATAIELSGKVNSDVAVEKANSTVAGKAAVAKAVPVKAKVTPVKKALPVKAAPAKVAAKAKPDLPDFV